MSGMTATFSGAINNANQIKDHVLAAQNAAIARATALQAQAGTAVTNIATSAANMRAATGEMPPEAPEFESSNAPDISFERTFYANPPTELDAPDGPPGISFSLGAIAPADRFRPTISSLNIPDAPVERPLPTLPEAPEARAVAIPARPTPDRPTMPDLVDIVIPTFAFAPLEHFDEQAPEWAGSSVSAMMQWSETAYTPVLMDEEIEVIRRMWAGGTGLPPAVEQALWERAASREDMAIARDVSAAAVEFSSRGFSLPPGMLVDRIDTIRTEGALRKQGLAREITIKIADTHIENLRFACTQALAAENVMIGLWSQMAQRQFEMAKVNMEGELALLNANIAIYNTRQAAWKTAADVHRIKLEERAQDLQQMRLLLEAETTKGTINEQRVRVFSELYKALQADVDLYRAEMDGARLDVEIQRSEVERYKAQVQAIAEIASLDKIRFEGYSSRIQGESAKAQLLQAQASAYGAYIAGYSAEANVVMKQAELEIAAGEAQLKGYIAQLEHKKAGYALREAQARVDSENARSEISMAVAQLQGITSANEVDTRRLEAKIRSETAVYEVASRVFSARQEQEIRLAGFQLEAMKSIAQAQSTLAAGAMAGIQLSSAANGGSTLNASAQDSVQTSVKL